MFACLLFLTALLGADADAEAEAPLKDPDAPEVWMCHRSLNELLDDADAWAFVRENIDGIQFYIGSLSQYSAAELEDLASMVEEADLQVSVECGGTLNFGPMDDSNGAWSARRELAKLKLFTEAGGHIDYLNLDGPIRRLLYPTGDREGFTDYTACARQLVVYMQKVLETYPDMKFFLLTNFPNWGYKGDVSYHARGPQRQDWGDYHDVLEAVLPVIQEADLPLRGLSIDNPYEYALGRHHSVTLENPCGINWGARIQDLQDYAEAADLEVNMIINSQKGGGSSGPAFQKATLEYLRWYLNKITPPDRIFIQSWYDYPKAVLPETAHGTMTALVKEAVLQLRTEK